MQKVPTATRQPGRKPHAGPTRPGLRQGTAAFKLPADYSDVPLPSGFTPSGPITIVEGPTVKFNSKGVLPHYKETV